MARLRMARRMGLRRHTLALAPTTHLRPDARMRTTRATCSSFPDARPHSFMGTRTLGALII